MTPICAIPPEPIGPGTAGTADNKRLTRPKPAPRPHPSVRHMIELDDASLTTLRIAVKCPICGGTEHVVVPREGYLDWVGGLPFWTSLRGVDDRTRELLITGIDDTCWARIFADGADGAERIISHLSAGVRQRVEKLAIGRPIVEMMPEGREPTP